MPGSSSILKLAGLKALLAGFALLLVIAQPATAQLSFKPTAEAVQEDKLLNALRGGRQDLWPHIDPGPECR